MVHKATELTDDGKQELALALLLWKDFKSQSVFDPDMTLRALKFAEYLGVKEEFGDLLREMPVMEIKPK